LKKLIEMTKFLLSILFFVLISNSVFSQKTNYQVVKGPEYEGKGSLVQSLIGNVEEGLLICRQQKRDLFLELVNFKGAVSNSVPLAEMKHKTLDKSFVEGFVLEGKLYLRFSAYDKKNKILHAIIDKYNPSTLKFESNVSSEEVDAKGTRFVYWYGIGASRAAREIAENGFYISNDGKYVVEYSSTFDKSKSANENVDIRVYDSNMEIFWQREFEIPYSNDKFDVRRVIIDDFGNAHLLGREYMEVKGPGSKRLPNSKYHVISFMKSGSSVKDNVLELGNNFITDAAIAITSEGNLISTGFYGGSSSTSIVGAFVMKVDVETKKILSTNLREFDKEFIQEGMSEKEKEKSDKKEKKGKELNLPDYDLDHLVLLPDGGWVLFAEQYYIVFHTTTSTSNGVTSTNTTTTYHYNDIIAVKMNSAGEIEWNSKVVKNQQSSGGTSALSYTLGYCEGKFTLVYNSLPNRKENVVKVSEINPSGEVNTFTLFSSSEDELNLHPAYSKRAKECKVLLYSSKKKTYQFSIMNKAE